MAQGKDQLKADMALIRQSGLLLGPWYLARRPQAGDDGVEDFCNPGWHEGASPNPYFSTAYYLAENPDVRSTGLNPLCHYIAFGEQEGRAPCAFFDPAWYRETYGVPPRDMALKHFLDRRFTGQVNPVPVFDAGYYLETNADVAAGGADPFEHFLGFGAAEGRNPAADFDVSFYRARYGPAIGTDNPLVHYLANRETGGFFPARPLHEQLIPGAVRRAMRPSPHFEDARPLPPGAAPAVKLLAYYLPQFHRIAENDAWWGKGFTDWTNLARALPRFTGHLQPRAPRDLGYYSLDDPATLRRQIDLAKAAGLAGFVFYFYWFNRHRLLEAPLAQLCRDPTLDFPFLVMWANENWTRRWDGLEREVLIAQEYRAADDPELIACFAALFADPRYIRVDGRPLLMIYRIDLVPDAAARLAIWRRLFRDNHGEDPLIVMAQSLGDYDPAPYGLDGAVEFPPHKLSQAATPINRDLDLLDPEFSAAVFDYADIAAQSLALPVPTYPLIKTIVPGWDNDPRREGKGLVLHDATPAKYQAWLENLVQYTAAHPFLGARIICVNAWNEWAEGAFLEPDIHFGAAFLNATARALVPRAMGAAAGAILLVGHDAQPHGSQMMLLHLARRLRRQWGMQVHLLLLGVGPLMGAYHDTAEVSVAHVRPIIENTLDKYREMGIRTAIVNSAAAARVVPWLTARGIAVTLLVHELPQLLREYNLEIQARLGGAAAQHMVFASEDGRRQFCAAIGLPGDNACILPQGNYLNIGFDAAARAETRRALGIADDDYLVLAAGFADFRKGFDLFLQIARTLWTRAKVHCLWVGEINFTLATYLGPEMALAAQGGFHHIGFTEDVARYFSAADVYALTSREDPFPTVVMEALACGVPCVAFDETGGIPALLRQNNAGLVAPFADTATFAVHLLSLLDHRRLQAGRARLIALAAAQFSYPKYVEALLHLAQPGLQTVSVCVLNYNYAHYLPGRLRTVFDQTYPVLEILFFDDASTDASLPAAREAAAAAGREMQIIANPQNSGAVFAQWRRAVQLARGDYIWIAEADDEAEPDFLARLIDALQACDAPILAFTDSQVIDADGKQLAESYQPYYRDAGALPLAASGQWPADDFARLFLAERNLILNVSAVLWRREHLLAALDACAATLDNLRLAGDWLVYLQALAGTPGQVAYVAAPLNTHRLHQSGVTRSLDPTVHAGEIACLQGIAAARLNLGKEALARQKAYLDAVSIQLGAKRRGKVKAEKL